MNVPTQAEFDPSMGEGSYRPSFTAAGSLGQAAMPARNACTRATTSSRGTSSVLPLSRSRQFDGALAGGFRSETVRRSGQPDEVAS